MKKRQALLIGGRYRRPLAGVSADIDAWGTFLCSSMGGCWRDDEVRDLSSWTVDDIRAAIKSARDNFYTMVIFAGHGEVRKDQYGFLRTYAWLNDDVAMSEHELNPGSERATLIMDCCRKVQLQLINESMEKYALDELVLNGVDTRKVYENELDMCETGFVKVYAADIGQSATDDESFSRTLIEGLRDAYVHGNMGRVVNIRDAVNLAGRILPPQQTPVYNGGRRLKHYPFAINPLVYE